MRKERLIEKKRKIAEEAIWNLREVLTDDDLRKFSRDQLETMLDILQGQRLSAKTDQRFIHFPPRKFCRKALEE